MSLATPLLAAEQLTYTLEPNPETGGIAVEFTWKTEGRGASLMGVSPRWGSVSDVPATLGDFNVDGAKSVKRDGATWIVKHAPGATFTVKYETKPKLKSFDWQNTHLPITTSGFFHGMGNGFLLVPESGGDVPREFDVVLRWKVPGDWKAACSWGIGRSVGGHIAATDLRHSVYLAGNLVTKTVEVEARKISVAMIDRFGFKVDEFLAMASAIIKAECDFMDDTQFPEFVITAIPVGEALGEGNTRASGAGLYNSFALFLAPRSKLNDAVEHLFAHELFHYWNGRLLGATKPEELVYWWIEGFTDYFALRILHESGYWNDALYLKWLNRHIREYYSNPAIGASNEEIGKNFWKQRETIGEIAYQRGLMLGVRWAHLSQQNGKAGGVDDLMKELVKRARTSKFELSNENVRVAGRELLGAWFTAEFDAYVSNAQKIELSPDSLGPRFSGQMTKVYDFALGFDREKSLSRKKVVGVVADSAAAKAGLRDGEAISGYNLHARADEKVDVTVVRDGKNTKISWFPRAGQHEVMQFRTAGGKTSQSGQEPAKKTPSANGPASKKNTPPTGTP